MDKRRNYNHRGGGQLEPLEDLNIDIIQYINDTDSPVDSPSLVQNMHQQRNQQQQMQHHVPDPHHNVVYQVQRSARLPDSPPNTDISGGGSSASPSSNSDPPYSPDQYGIYPMNAGLSNNQDLLLGVHGLQGGMMLQEQLHQRAADINQLVAQQQQQQNCFVSTYSTNLPVTISPPSNRGNNNGYIMGYDNNDLFNLLGTSSDGSLNSCGESVNRKRPRLDPRMERMDNREMKYNMGMDNRNITPSPTSPMGSYDDGYGNMGLNQRTIKFNKFEEEKWVHLYDRGQGPLKQMLVHVIADKGFNYSVQDNCFVNQKKNHFQVTVTIEAFDANPPFFVKKGSGFSDITHFTLSFSGVKAESLNTDIQIKQSQTDRKPIPHAPVILEIQGCKATKVLVPRLHFQETTQNNMRKNYRPNPEQRFFLLVVKLIAHTSDKGEHLVQAYHSERVIVRAGNPGSFEPPETDATWGKNQHALFSNGPVVIGGDMPVKDARLTVHGDIFSAGRMIHPSDRRLKKDITAMETNVALENIQKLSVVNYFYKKEIAEKWGLTEEQRRRTGLIAQELQEVLPDAVNDIGDYLTIDENRVFYETLMATQELCRLNGELDNKIDEKVEEISQRLARYARRKKFLGSMASNLNGNEQGDTKSNLSYSRSSLASSYAPSYRKEKRERQCRSSHCNGGRAEPLCSSRLTQGTIVTLVFVMAICLLAMSSLYVLDWHNRNFGVRTDHTEAKPEVGHMIDYDFAHLPMIQPDAPPLGGVCRLNNCHTYCCLDREMYETGPNSIQVNSIVTLDAGKNLASHSAPDVLNGVGRHLSTGVSIRIPALNATIDNRYCIKNSCNPKKGRIFNLYIPVSPYLPTVNIEVVFSAPRGKVVNNCGYLADFAHKSCSLDNPFGQESTKTLPTVAQIDENVFDLSVGTYLQSAYRFRIGYNTESCYSSEDHLNEEYNLVFYRTCAPPVTPTEPTSLK